MIIHIGMPRSASTFLQREFFSKVEDFSFYGVDITHYSKAFQRLLYQDDSLFDQVEFEKTAAELRSGNAILSNELFVGQSLYFNSSNRSRTARRLQHFFPDAEIVLLLRNQVSLLQSLYSIGVYSGYTCTPDEYIRFSDSVSTVKEPLYPTFSEAESAESYRFAPLVSLYQSLFENVHVLLFEDFNADPKDFINRLSEKLALKEMEVISVAEKVNRSLSAQQIKYTRWLNGFKPLALRNRFGGAIFDSSLRFIEHRSVANKHFEFSKPMVAKLKETFRDDNLRLQELIPGFADSEVFKKHYLW